MKNEKENENYEQLKGVLVGCTEAWSLQFKF